MNENLIHEIQSPAYDREGAIISVPVAFLLQSVVNSCDFGDMTCEDAWATMISDKASDTGFGHLLDSIIEHGLIPEAPIGIAWDDWYGNGLRITEGHHRLTAAILLGLDEVYISKWGKNGSPTGEYISAHFNHAEPKGLDVEF